MNKEEALERIRRVVFQHGICSDKCYQNHACPVRRDVGEILDEYLKAELRKGLKEGPVSNALLTEIKTALSVGTYRQCSHCLAACDAVRLALLAYDHAQLELRAILHEKGCE